MMDEKPPAAVEPPKTAPVREKPVAKQAATVPAQEPPKKRRVTAWRDALCPPLGKQGEGRRARAAFLAKHAAADTAHGWTLEEQQLGRTVVLTEQDYRAALEAAGTNDAKGRVRVHGPALGKHIADKKRRHVETAAPAKEKR